MGQPNQLTYVFRFAYKFCLLELPDPLNRKDSRDFPLDMGTVEDGLRSLCKASNRVDWRSGGPPEPLVLSPFWAAICAIFFCLMSWGRRGVWCGQKKFMGMDGLDRVIVLAVVFCLNDHAYTPVE
jgi:hypothetical protein